jgi:hypothetical protein
VATSSAATTQPFSAGQVTETPAGGTSQVPVTFPVALAKGDSLHVPVHFTPGSPGGATGAVSFAVQSARVPAVDVPLSGAGTQAGLYPSVSSLALALMTDHGALNVPVGITAQGTVQITNGGTAAETVTSVTPPAGPFTAVGLPAPGTTIEPGQSVTVQVTFAPQRAGPATGSFTVTGDTGTAATVHLSGTSVPAVSRFALSAGTVNFGSVPAGKKVTAVIGVSNAGNQPATVTTAAPLHQPFAARYPVPRGLVVNAGDDLAITVSFRPARKGRFAGIYRLTWTDRFGTHVTEIPLTGTGVLWPDIHARNVDVMNEHFDTNMRSNGNISQ